jgi:hypothetical protein
LTGRATFGDDDWMTRPAQSSLHTWTTSIGAFVGVYNIAIQSGRRVPLRHPQPFVRHVLDLTGVPRMLTAGPNEPAPSAFEANAGSS